MSFLETKHKKKSAIITTVILGLIMVGVFNFGMQYLDPPNEYGVAINFGDSNVGNGDPVVKTKANPTVKKVEKQVEEKEERLEIEYLIMKIKKEEFDFQILPFLYHFIL